MVLSGERPHGSRNTGFRASIDGYATTILSPRKRASVAFGSPLFTSKSADPFPSSSPLPPPPPPPPPELRSPKQHKSNIMSSFFSRFSSRGKAKLSISTDSPKPSYSRNSSVPNTPVTPGRQTLSIPIVDPIPAPNQYWTIENFPLCVAYVQAIKTSQLPACSISPEKILRHEVERSKNMGPPGTKRGRIRNHVHSRSTDFEWTRKLFVLVPGILLQYSSDGTDDRLPEKVLELTASSLAFASDAIPGRPWVLQVYRSAGADGSLLPERKHAFMAKVSLKGGSKNNASALLLVFESAEEMENWMVILRGEAARLGGGCAKRKTSASQFKIDQDPIRQNHGIGIAIDEEQDQFERRVVINHDESSETEDKRASSHYRSSTDAERSVNSQDQVVLDGLRGGSRLSLHAGGDQTRILTVPSSPDTSPEREYTHSKSDTTLRPSLSPRCRSSIELRSAAPLSAIDKDGNLYWISRTPSPPLNNFSFPAYRQPRPRPVSIQTTPSTTPTSLKPRPFSMTEQSYYSSRTPTSPLLSASSPLISIPARSRSLRRRSLGTLNAPDSRAPHPPPNAPLPKVPSPVIEHRPPAQRKSSSGSGWISNGRKDRRRSRQHGLGISGVV